MRFVVTGEWRQNRLLRLILAAFLVYVALFWLTNALLFFTHMGFSYEAVVAHYLGSEEAFAQPRSFKVLLEVSHAHLFSMGILLLTMTHLVLFVPIGGSVKALLVVASFAAALADEAAGWLIRYVHPGFAYLKLAGFAGLQITLAAMIVLVAGTLWRPAPGVPGPRRRVRQSRHAEPPVDGGPSGVS
jgi:hypothetical protein